MEKEQMKNFSEKAAKLLISSGAIALLLYYGSTNSVTIQQATAAFASIPLSFVLFLELLDRKTDMGTLYGKIRQGGTGLAGSLGFAAIGFFVVMWAISRLYPGPAGLFVAGITALYIFAPDTGEDPWYFVMWLAATIATMFSYFQILPPIQGLPHI